MECQLVPPHVHRRNLVERAIKTFKDYFLAGLATIDEKNPIHLWRRLLPQETISLNMTRILRIHLALSTYHGLNGALDYNKSPFAPIGVKHFIHEKLSV